MKWREKIQEMDRNEVFDKLEGLRGALIRMFILVGVLSVVSYFFWKDALHFLQKPLGLPLIMYDLPEAFFTSLRLALFLGIFLSFPFIINGLWGAFVPLFAFNARRYSLPIVLAATGLFYGGAFFCYFLVLPVGINFLVTYGAESNLQPMIGLSKISDLCGWPDIRFRGHLRASSDFSHPGKNRGRQLLRAGEEPKVRPPGQLGSFGDLNPHSGRLYHAPDDGPDSGPLRSVHLAGPNLRKKKVARA